MIRALPNLVRPILSDPFVSITLGVASFVLPLCGVLGWVIFP